MLSPLDAASLASCVVQFVDMTTKVVVKAKEIYETGSDLESSRLRIEATDMKALNQDLAKRERLRWNLPDAGSNDAVHVLPNTPVKVEIMGDKISQKRNLKKEVKLAQLRVKEEEKLRKNRLELRAIEDRIQTSTALNALSERDYSQRQKELQESSTALFRMRDNLKGREMQRFSEARQLARGERELESLVTQCDSVADEIILYLGRFEPEKHSGIWKSTSKAIQAVWRKDRIETFHNRLESLRSQISIRVLAALNAKADFQLNVVQNGLENIGRGGREIVEIMSINQSILESRMNHIHQTTQQLAEYRHNKTIGAILTLRNGDTRVLRPSSASEILVEDSQQEQTFVTLRGSTSRDGGTIEVENRSHDYVQTQILDCLYFRQITDRVDDVSLAHRKTFEWVFHDSAFEGKHWNHLPLWLEFGSGCYWVNGKAGAGKSTLMKFIREDERTRVALTQWAAGQRLVLASFFFWNLGSEIQRSQDGLLRALLFDVVEAQPDIAAHILPGIYRAAVHGRSIGSPSHSELRKAFHNLVWLKDNDVKICLFVDGIDEYEGDHAELAELFASIPDDSCVKVLLSSRPIPACVEVFSGCQKLQLQDLTYEDVRIYVEDRVGKNESFRRLEREDEALTSLFLHEIVSKASGVFLWVIIVVRRVLDALRNGDTLALLRLHLDALPEDLENLYHHMLRKLNPLYQKQASEIFQIVFRSITLDSEEPLTTMQLAHIEDKEPEEAISREISILSTDQKYDRCVSIEARIRSRCCGLVEVLHEQHDWCSDPAFQKERTIASRISFLHRTVAEFLQSSNVWEGLVALTAPQHFDVNLSLLAAYLVETKTQESGETVDTTSDPVWRSMRACLQYGRLAEGRNHLRTEAFIDELDVVMAHHWRKVKEFHATSVSYFPAPESDGEDSKSLHWANSVFQTMEGVGDLPEYSDVNESICSLVAGFGLVRYLEQKLSKLSSSFTIGRFEQCILTAITGHARNFKKNSSPAPRTSFARFLTNDAMVPSENYVEIVRLLLDSIPHDKDKGNTVSKAWVLILKCTSKLFQYSGGFWNSFVEEEIILWARLLTMFLRFQVDVNHKIELGTREGAHRQSALLIVMSLFQQLPPRATAMRSVQSARDEILSLMERQGAIKREWINGKLVQGPPEALNGTVKIVKGKSIQSQPESSYSTRKGFRDRLRSFRQS